MNSLKLIGWVGTGGDAAYWDALILYFLIGTTLISIVVTYVILYAIQRIIDKMPKFDWRTLALAVLIGPIIFPGSIYIRDYINQEIWLSVQEKCAKQVGYSHPAENENLNIATASTQLAYRNCVSK